MAAFPVISKQVWLLVLSNNKDETEWNSQMISVCRQGCSSVSWCPFRPSSSEGVTLLRVAVGGGDNCIYILRYFIVIIIDG